MAKEGHPLTRNRQRVQLAAQLGFRRARDAGNAIGNAGDASLAAEAERLLDDTSPLVRGAAVWALSRLLPRGEFQKLRRDDSDATVNEEWNAVLS